MHTGKELFPLRHLARSLRKLCFVKCVRKKAFAFFLVQMLVYVICLQKIMEIDRQKVAPLMKLKLMENEENLFDMGLYVGIAGTAAALVLQVMDIIQADLVAAYASNLFGITCVAWVKIRHVRPYKRKLILSVNEFQQGDQPGEEAA